MPGVQAMPPGSVRLCLAGQFSRSHCVLADLEVLYWKQLKERLAVQRKLQRRTVRQQLRWGTSVNVEVPLVRLQKGAGSCEDSCCYGAGWHLGSHRDWPVARAPFPGVLPTGQGPRGQPHLARTAQGLWVSWRSKSRGRPLAGGRQAFTLRPAVTAGPVTSPRACCWGSICRRRSCGRRPRRS